MITDHLDSISTGVRVHGDQEPDRFWWRLPVRILLMAAACAVLASAATFVLARIFAHTTSGTVLNKIHLNLSIGIDLALPTWYASLLWGLFAILAAVRAGTTRRYRLAWGFMALVSAVASVDEYLMLHERLSRPGRVLENQLGIDLGGASWVPIGASVAAIVAALLFRAIWQLPMDARQDILVGGALFILGAVGFEMLQHALFDPADHHNWPVMMVNHTEEALELVGLIVAMRGLARVLPLQLVGSASATAIPSLSRSPSAQSASRAC